MWAKVVCSIVTRPGVTVSSSEVAQYLEHMIQFALYRHQPTMLNEIIYLDCFMQHMVEATDKQANISDFFITV